MTKRMLVSVLATLMIVLQPLIGLAQTPAASLEPIDIGLEPVAEEFDQPLGVVDAHDDSGVLYVVEKPGRIHTIVDSERSAEPFLDITDRVGSSGFERGLLGLAFPVNYADSGLFYVNYTDLDGNTVVSRFHRSADDATKADADSEDVILTQDQPYANHNGGQLEFGPDNYLYIGLGDGGSGGDPQGNAQRLDTWLGKILRIEVDPEQLADGEAYAVPEDNPFVDQDGALPEIFAYGLRNPWRFSFDPENGNLWIADVGQERIEEVNLVTPDMDFGLNFGWNTMEGTECYLEEGCDQTDLELPVMEYTHDVGGCSITGGYVYRGEDIPDLTGRYLFGDYCSGLLWQGVSDGNGRWTMTAPLETGLSISSFGQDDQGNIYVCDITGGTVYVIAAGL